MILWAQFSPLLISRKALKILHGDVCCSWLAVTFTRLPETFCKKNMCFIACTFTKITYILTPHYLFGAVSQRYLKCCLPDYSLHFVPYVSSTYELKNLFFVHVNKLLYFSLINLSYIIVPQLRIQKAESALKVVLVVKNSPANAGDIKRPGFDPWVGKIPWRRAWKPTPVFLPGESPGQKSLEGYSPWGCKESDTTEVT